MYTHFSLLSEPRERERERERERRKNNTYNGARREHEPPKKGLDHCVDPMNEL